MKTNAVYLRALSQLSAKLRLLAPGAEIASETAMAAELGVSRTTVRAVLSALEQAGVLHVDGRHKVLIHPPERKNEPTPQEAELLSDMLERRFMAWMVGPECYPGKSISALDLARQFGVSTSTLRECLSRFGHYGLLERQSNGRWRALGLTVEFVADLFDMREVMEFRAVDRFVTLAPGHPAWAELDLIEADHRAMLRDIDTQYRAFSELDDRLHRLIHNVAKNRFFQNIQGVMSVIFHYHYQWNKRDEKARNTVAIHEHLAYIDGLKSRDAERARRACRAHLQTARKTLLASVEVGQAPQ